MNFLKKFNISSIIKMSEIKKFRDDWVIPSNFLDEFGEYEESQK